MANSHHNVSIVGRGTGSGSAVASSAYRHNSNMKSEYDGRTFDYSKKDDLVHAEIMVPADAAEWAHEAYGSVALGRALDGREATDEARFRAVAVLSARLWNHVEQFECANNRRHMNAQYARSFTVSLPNCLSREDQIALGQEYFKNNFTDVGMIVDWVIHDPKTSKVSNPHIHAMVSLRKIGEKDWGLKGREWNSRATLLGWRSSWAHEANIVLERVGSVERVDHRSYVDQGIELEPTSYDPYVAEYVETVDLVARNKARADEARARNVDYLLKNPEHILRVVAAERSVFLESDVVLAFRKRLGGDVTPEVLMALVDQAMASREIVLLGDDVVGYSTKAQVSIETNLMVDALELNAGHLVFDGAKGVAKRGVGVAGVGLGDDQMAALLDMVSDKRLSLVTGYAGAGKTRTIRAATQVWKERGFEVLGGAVSGRATQELTDIDGMKAASLAAWEARWSRGQTPKEGGFVFFMDEAGMVGSSHWERVQRRVLEMGGKFVAVGDPEQLQPVLDTGAFVAVRDQVGAAVISTVHRMENPQDREATKLFSQGVSGAKRALEYYEGIGGIESYYNEGVTIGRIALTYFDMGSEGDSRIAAAFSNKHAVRLNSSIRDVGGERGLVDVEGQVDFGLIRRIDRSGLHPKIETAAMLFGRGDRVVFTQSHRELDIAKSSFATVLSARAGELDVLVDGNSPRRVTIDMTAFDHFDYGYAATTHKLQGMSADHVFAMAHPRMTRHVAHVMMTRHKKSVKMHVPKSLFRGMSFEAAATRSGYLNVDIDLQSDRQIVRSQPSLGVAGNDSAGSHAPIDKRQDFAVEGVGFKQGKVLEDAHLSSVFRHYYGLLSSEYVAGEGPMFGDDPHGFVDRPEAVIDQILKTQSTLSASDVAGALAGVVFDPESFERLFYEAMEHPDLVVLREDGVGGGRVYSTNVQVTRELSAMDRGVALAVGSQDPQLEVGYGYVAAALTEASLDKSVEEAVKYGAQGGQVRLISGGSGAGKTQALGAVAQAHEWAGFDVVAIAPTRRTAVQFEAQTGVTTSSFGSLVYGLDRGTKHLDSNSVIVLDHSELLGLGDAERLFEVVAQSGAKLVAGYNGMGLSSVQAGSVFGDLEARVGSYELGGSLRQSSEFGRDVNGALSGVRAMQNSPTEIFMQMSQDGDLVAGGTLEEAIGRLADAYIQDPSADKIAVAQSGADVMRLNEAIGLRMAGRSGDGVGLVDSDGPKVGHDLNALSEGDKVVLSEYYMPKRLAAGEQGVVIEASADTFTLRLGRVQDERYVEVSRSDAEFRIDLNFAQTIYSAQGQGHSSVHLLGTKGLSSAGLSTAVGLYEDKMSIVLPVAKQGDAVEFIEMIRGRAGQDLSVASYITDKMRSVSQISDQANTHFDQERGLGNPYAAPSVEILSQDQMANAAYLKDRPEHVLTLLGAERSIFSAAEIEAALVRRLGLSVDNVGAYMERVMDHPALVALDRFGLGGRRLYTTRAHVVRETNLIVEARAALENPLDLGIGADRFTLSNHLGAAQDLAVRAMLNEQRISLITGYAGTGKTTIVSEAARVWKERGYEVLGGSLSGRATQELSGVKDMEIASLAAWEAKWARGTQHKEGKFVFFMDEAGMVGSDVWSRVQSRVLAMGGKLVAVGDPEQLQPISDSNVFKALEPELGVSVIDDVRRQSNALEREYTKMLARGGDEAVEAIRGYAEQGSVLFKDNEVDAVAAIAREYFAMGTSGQSRRAYAHTVRDVVALNEAVREEAVKLGVVESANIQNYGLIERIDRSGGVERVETAALLLGKGDEVIFTQAHRDLRIPKSSFATVLAARPGEVDLLIDGDDARQVTIDMTLFNQLDYGFASTIYKGQGASKDNVLVLGHAIMDRPAHYVALSRHIEEVRFYVPRTRIPNMEALERLVQRDGYQSLAASEISSAITESSGHGLGEKHVGARVDREALASNVAPVTFESDAHLASVANRMTGLLRSNYVSGDPMFGEDPRGYAQTPQRIVDDLILHQSTLRASEVSRVLSGVVNEPDTFARMFREAMAHPDLVVLSEEGIKGEGRVYSTQQQVGLELDVVDRGMRLALMGDQGEADVTTRVQRRAGRAHNLSTEQQDAMGIASRGRFSVISGGSGSGKSRLAAALGDAHAQSDWSVIRVSPTGVGADNLRREGGETRVMTLAGLEYMLEQNAEGTGFALSKNTAIILDEAGQVGAKTADKLLRRIEESGAKLIALRDNDQLGPFEAAPIFQALEARIGGVELGASQRSKNPIVGPAVERIAAPEMYLDKVAADLLDAGVLHGGGTRAASIARLARDYVADPSLGKVVLAHSRADVATANRDIRALLDQENPDRMAHLAGGATTQEGSIADLRVGDRIVLASHFATGKKRMRAGTEFQVERRENGKVVLRSGAGEQAQYLKFSGEDTDFEYRFGFATTIHGSKGNGRDSVHMLGTPGMSRNVFYTGAALHQKSLNVVLPTSQANVEQVTRAILQTDDTARSVLDYGFEVAQHARAAVNSGAPALEHEPSKLVDGFDRMIDWVADRLDGGSDRALPATRAVRLRAAVVAELIAARGETDTIGQGAGFTAKERQMLERNVDTLINRRSWTRLLGMSGEGMSGEGRVAEGKSDVRSEGVTQGSAQDQMVARILERGAVAAGSSKDDGLREWFDAAVKAVEARVERAQAPQVEMSKAPDDKVDLVKLMAGNERWNQTKNVRRLGGKTDEELLKEISDKTNAEHAERLKEKEAQTNMVAVSPTRAVVPSVIKEEENKMDYVPKMSLTEVNAGTAQDRGGQDRLSNLARAFTSAVSRHIEYENPVHAVDDLNGDIRRLLEGSHAFKADEAGAVEAIARDIVMKREIVGAKYKLIDEILKEDGRSDALHWPDKAVYENRNPFYGFSTQNMEKYKVRLPALVDAITLTSQEPQASDYDAAKMVEYARLKEPVLLAVAVVAAQVAGYERVSSVQGQTFEAIREKVLQELSIDERDPSLESKEQKQGLLDRVYNAFTRKEIGTLINGDEATSKSLPAATINPKLVKETLAQLNNVHKSKTAMRHTSGSLNGLDKQVIAQTLAKGIGFGW